VRMAAAFSARASPTTGASRWSASIVGDDRHAASWVELTNADGAVQPGLCFFDLDAHGGIVHITDFWPEPYALPSQRAHLVDRY
jgi:hypothetical protein